MIGASLSLCISDIIRGKVNLEDVEILYVSTRFEDVEVIFDYYKDAYWYKDREKAHEILVKLYKEGRIHQARFIDEKLQPKPVPIWYKDVEHFISRQRELDNEMFADYVERNHNNIVP